MNNTGLANLGNTCFLNACLQALYRTHELTPVLNKPANRQHCDIALAWNELRKAMLTSNAPVSPNQFVNTVQKIARKKNRDLFTGWNQNDMPEFLLFMIECIHESVSRKVSISIAGTTQNTTDELAIKCYSMIRDYYSKDYSEVLDSFYGVYVSEIMSADGRVRLSIKPESFFVLDLPIPRGSVASLYDCFDTHVASEMLSGENAWYNETAKRKEDVNKRIRFWNFPSVLIIVLQRFSPDGRHKHNGFISCPLENLDLSKYVVGYNPKSYVYDLYAVCNHIGSVHGGHYTAFVKTESGSWVHCNDQIIEPVSNIITPMTYCLFYRKKIRL